MLQDIIKDTFKEYESRATVSGDFINFPEATVKLMKKILMSNSTTSKASDIAGGNGQVAPIINAMRELEKVGLGSTFYTKGKNHKTVCSFKKFSMDVLSNNRELAQKIQEIGLLLNEFMSHMQPIEQQEAHSQTATVAMPHSSISVKRISDIIENTQ